MFCVCSAATGNYNYLDNFMVSKLFKLEKSDAKGKVYSNIEDKYVKLKVPLFSGVKDAICEILPSCLRCCVGSA